MDTRESMADDTAGMGKPAHKLHIQTVNRFRINIPFFGYEHHQHERDRDASTGRIPFNYLHIIVLVHLLELHLPHSGPAGQQMCEPVPVHFHERVHRVGALVCGTGWITEPDHHQLPHLPARFLWFWVPISNGIRLLLRQYEGEYDRLPSRPECRRNSTDLQYAKIYNLRHELSEPSIKLIHHNIYSIQLSHCSQK